jgi:hypothetical protein
VLLGIAHHQLDFEISRVLTGDFIQAKKYRFQRFQIGHLLDLAV